MSRHEYEFVYKGRRAKVTLGYDRPLKEFFMNVEYLDPHPNVPEASGVDASSESDENSDLVYSNLLERHDAAMGLEHYRDVLRSLEIEIPESLFREASNDASNRTGNRIARHFDDGRIEDLLPVGEASRAFSVPIPAQQKSDGSVPISPPAPGGQTPVSADAFEECSDEVLECIATLGRYPPSVLAYVLRAHLQAFLEALLTYELWTREQVSNFIQEMADETLQPVQRADAN